MFYREYGHPPAKETLKISRLIKDKVVPFTSAGARLEGVKDIAPIACDGATHPQLNYHGPVDPDIFSHHFPFRHPVPQAFSEFSPGR